MPRQYYAIQDGKVSIEPANRGDEPFAAGGACLFQEWIEPEQLFGCVRIHNGDITLQPGLVHQANGGVLILSAGAAGSAVAMAAAEADDRPAPVPLGFA